MEFLCASIVIFSTLFLATECQDVPAKKFPKLLVITYDGFKNDYFNRNVTPYFNEIKFNGIYADYMINTFPSKTLPNHHTMATGLYAENHGVIDSGYYDVKAGNQVRYSYDLFHYNKDILPLWILNERAGYGRRSGIGPWPGAEFEYGGSKPTFARKWKLGASFKKRVDDIISWFNHPETPINLAMVYLEEPDHYGHYVGNTNDRFNAMVKKVDETTRYFHKRLNESGLLNDINIIHVGDHGMASVKLDRIIDLDKYVDPADYRCMNYTSMLCVFPLPGKEQSVYDSFQKAANETQGLDVYWRRDIPERFHYSNNPRIGPILVLAKVGYAYKALYGDIYLSEKDWGVEIDDDNEYGLHGYDNVTPEMHTMFFGLGPAFLPNCKIQPFVNINLFPLFCNLLGIQTPQVNGTLDVFKKCLREYHS